MLVVLLKSAMTFLATVCLHVAVWRAYRPIDYRAWVAALLGIFVVGGGAIAAVLAFRVKVTDTPPIGGPVVEWLAIMLLQTSVGIVYVLGYTLLLVGSPSLVILERLARAPLGLRVDEVGLPMTADDLVGLRLDNLLRSGFITRDPNARRLTPKGRRLTAFVLLYRHLIGLPDGEGG